MCLGFVGANGNILFHKEIIVKNQAETVIEVELPEMVDFAANPLSAIIPNYKDWSFCKIVLDKISLKWVQGNIALLEGELTRQLVWRSLFDMMRDAKEISAPELAYMMAVNYPAEKSVVIRTKVMSFFMGTIWNYSPESMQDELKVLGWNLCYSLVKEETDTVKSKQLHGKLLGFISNEESLKICGEWIKGTHAFLKYDYLVAAQKFSILNIMFKTRTLPDEELNSLLNKFEEADKTDCKKESRIAREAMMANEEQREKLWDEFLNKDTKISHKLMGCSLGGFFSKWVPYEQKEKYWDKFWDVIVEQFNSRGRAYSDGFFNAARPKYNDSAKLLKKMEELYNLHDQYDGYWKKNVMSELEFYRRATKVKLFAFTQLLKPLKWAS